MHPLVLAYTASAFAIGLLSGIWLGFRIVTRDASLIAALDRRVGEALSYSAAAKGRADLIEAQWGEHLEALERKRAQARAERQRVDAKVAAAEPTPAPESATLSPRDRRRLIAHRLRA